MSCQKQVPRAGTNNYVPWILWDIITCPCLYHLLLAWHSSYNDVRSLRLIIMYTAAMIKHFAYHFNIAMVLSRAAYNVFKPTLYVARLTAIAIEAYKCYVNENLQYNNGIFDSFNNMRGEPLAEQPKFNTKYSGSNNFTYQAVNIWNFLPPVLQGHLPFLIQATAIEIARLWLPMRCFMSFTCLISMYLKWFTSFINAFDRFLMACHVFFYIQCVFYKPHTIFTGMIHIEHFSFSRLISSG